MGWNAGKYYTRSKKIAGRTFRQYIGGGEVGRLAAQYDQIQREIRMQRRDAARHLMAKLEEVDETVTTLCQRAELAARAAMHTAGYYQHHRGEWRKRSAKQHSIDA